MSHFYLGLDLGQRADYSALAILHFNPGRATPRHPVTFGPTTTPQLRLVALQRLALGSPYTEVASWLRRRLAHPDLLHRATVAVDASGPGLPFLDFLTTSPLPANLLRVCITAAGDPHCSRGLLHVSRTHLLTNLALLLRNRSLAISHHLPEAPALLAELAAVRAHTFRSSSHDDLVIALALAAFQPARVHRAELLHQPPSPTLAPLPSVC